MMKSNISQKKIYELIAISAKDEKELNSIIKQKMAQKYWPIKESLRVTFSQYGTIIRLIILMEKKQ